MSGTLCYSNNDCPGSEICCDLLPGIGQPACEQPYWCQQAGGTYQPKTSPSARQGKVVHGYLEPCNPQTDICGDRGMVCKQWWSPTEGYCEFSGEGPWKHQDYPDDVVGSGNGNGAQQPAVTNGETPERPHTPAPEEKAWYQKPENRNALIAGGAVVVLGLVWMGMK